MICKLYNDNRLVVDTLSQAHIQTVTRLLKPLNYSMPKSNLSPQYSFKFGSLLRGIQWRNQPTVQHLL